MDKFITAPDGSLWQLVPVEPTEHMRQAAYMAQHYDMSVQNPNEWGAVDKSYAAAIAAAPEFGGVAVGRMLITEATEGWVDNVELTEAGRQLPPGEYRIYAHPPAADEAMGRDAARYRWLRQFDIGIGHQGYDDYRWYAYANPEPKYGRLGLDAAIDAAMSGTAEKAGEES